jgi:myo-inositol-1(or 4)-monophosphatase
MTKQKIDTSNELLPIEELNKLLDAATTAALEAGQIIVKHLDGGTEVSKLKANPRDLLTEIDPLCESTIKEIVLTRFPHHKFLGEEDVDPGKEASAAALKKKLIGGNGDGDEDGNSDFLWIVDPIDGKVYVSHSN